MECQAGARAAANGAGGIVTPRWACCPTRGRITERMKKISYGGYRFPPEVIHQAIWLCLRFTLSLRDVEDLLAERGVAVSYETVRRWVNHFGPMIAADLRKRRLCHVAVWRTRSVGASGFVRPLRLRSATCSSPSSLAGVRSLADAVEPPPLRAPPTNPRRRAG